MRNEIKKAMRAQGLSASALADKAGVRIASFTEYLAERKELRSDNLEKIFAVLGMKLQSTNELADSFKEGSLYPVYERMFADIPEKGLVGNSVISKSQLASYIIGFLAARISVNFHPASFSPRQYTDSLLNVNKMASFNFLDKIVFRETHKKPILFNKTIVKMAVYAACFDSYEKEIFANLCAEIPDLGTDEVDDTAFLASFMRYMF